MAAPIRYGSWPSSISAEMVAAGSVRISTLRTDGADLYWLERRASENGRAVLVGRDAEGNIADVLPDSVSVGTRVHEYGGGAYAVHQGNIVFSNREDNKLYLRRADSTELVPLDHGDFRCADLTIDATRGLVLCVGESHKSDGVHNFLAAISLEGDPPRILTSGEDFYSSPRLSGDGLRLCWLTWSLPCMPWDRTRLWIADLALDGSLLTTRPIAGNGDEALVQPEWSAEGGLYVMSDRSGWWNLHRLVEGDLTAVAPMSAECAYPSWGFGNRSYVQRPNGTIAFAARPQDDPRWRLLLLGTDGALSQWTDPDEISELGPELCVLGEQVVALASGPRVSASVVLVDAVGETAVRTCSPVTLPPAAISVATPLFCPSRSSRTIPCFLYRPDSPEAQAPSDERPPLLVRAHGGPTSGWGSDFSLETQYWTSRGFAVLDVDFAGSSGRGREHRRLLNGEWGVTDVDDCVDAVRHLVTSGLVNESGCLITGGSSGGYTVLCALTRYPHVFAAGASWYGIGDLRLLAADTHKFESGYLQTLLGATDLSSSVYEERSPLNHVESVAAPLIIFQGEEDPVVPPNQARAIAASLDQRGVPHAVYYFAGEEHGFRASANIATALRAELAFFRAVLGLESPPGDEIALPVVHGEALLSH